MAGTEVKDAVTPEKQANVDHAKEAAAKTIQAMPVSAQRESVTKEWQRVASECGSSLPELTVGHDHGKQVAVITKDGKPLEVIDESGKAWQSDGKNLFSDGQNQRLLAPKTVDGQPAKNADGTPQYDLMPVQTRQVDNGDGTKHSVITQITDGDGRKWVSADGQQFIGAAGSDGAGQAGDQRVLKDNNGSLELTDPKGGTLSEQAIKGKEAEIQNLIKSSTSSALNFDETGFAPPPPDVVDGSKLNKVLENTSPELLARFDKDLNLRETLKAGMSSKDYEDITRILDGSKSIVTAHADRIFANGTGATEVDSTQAEQEMRRLVLQTNSGDMPKLNDDLLKRINADPTEKKQYDQYVEQHKNDPGFDSKNAALLSFSQHWSKETQDAMGLLVKGNDKLDTADGGTTPRAQLVKQALNGKDFDLFKTAVAGAPPEARTAIKSADVDKTFTENRFLSSRPTAESERNLAIAHDLLAKGDVQPSTLIKFGNADQAEKILAGLTPEQRNSYIQGKDNADSNNPDHQFYASMQEAFKKASGNDAVKMLKLDDEARKQDGSFVSTLAKHEGWLFNDSGNQIKGDFGSLTEDQRKDLSENYTVRRQQMEDMMKALDRDPKDVLEKFDQFFKKQPNAQPDSDGAAMTLLDKVRTEQSKPQFVAGDMDGSLGAAVQAENIAKALQHGFQDDPGLFDRLKNPQTDSEKQLAETLKHPEKLFGASKDQYGKVAIEGKLPLGQSLIIDRGDPQQTARDILGASPDDQKRFLSDPLEAKKDLGSLAGESNVDQKYDVMKNVLIQGKMQPEDSARAVAIGWKQPEDLKSLNGLSSEMGADYQKKYGEDLQLSLLNKFGHQDNSVNDFLSKYNNVFQKSDSLSHDTAVAGSGWASKILDGSGSMSPQEMTLAASQMADLSAKLQKQLNESPDGASPEIKAFVESQKRLKDAIDNHQDATKQLTDTVDKAVNVAITAAIIAGTLGEASVPLLMAGIAAGGAGRYAVKDELMGANWKDKDKTKETFDIAVDTVAQLGATRLLKIAEVFKGMEAGKPLTSAARTELQALGVNEETMGKLSVALEKPSVPSLPSAAVRELPPPASAVRELPATATTELKAAEDVANRAALPKPTGQEIATTTPTPAASIPTESTAASQSLTTRPQELAKVAQDVMPAKLPVEAPLKLPAPSASDIISGQANPAALAELSPKTKEFLFQMAQLSGIGAIDAKLKGQSAVEGALEWAAMGAAAHGVLTGLRSSGITTNTADTVLPIEVKPVATTNTADTILPAAGQEIAAAKDPLNLPRTTVDPTSIDSTDEGLPAVRQTSAQTATDPLPVVRAPIDSETLVPATDESTIPAVRKATDPVSSEAAVADETGRTPAPPISPERAAIVAAQAALLLPKEGQNTTPEKVEPQPVKAPDVPPPTPTSVDKPLEPTATLAALATVKNWEGPFHSADRVLQAVLGRRPTFEEIRTLTRAMQEQFKLDHNGQDIKQVDLKHGDQFLTAQNAESLLGQVAKNNPELAGQIKSYMQVDQDLGAKLGRPAAIDEVRAVTTQLQHDFMAKNQLQNFAQADAQKWQAYEANADIPQTLQTLEANNAHLKQIAENYQATGKLPPDGIISQRAFPTSAGTLHHNKRVARR